MLGLILQELRNNNGFILIDPTGILYCPLGKLLGTDVAERLRFLDPMFDGQPPKVLEDVRAGKAVVVTGSDRDGNILLESLLPDGAYHSEIDESGGTMADLSMYAVMDGSLSLEKIKALLDLHGRWKRVTISARTVDGEPLYNNDSFWRHFQDIIMTDIDDNTSEVFNRCTGNHSESPRSMGVDFTVARLDRKSTIFGWSDCPGDIAHWCAYVRQRWAPLFR